MGGGWIQPLPVDDTSVTSSAQATALVADNNTKATFGFVASGTLQPDNTVGDTQGELTYHDHGVVLRVHSLSVETLVVVDPQTVRFTGMAEVTTSAGTVPRAYVVTVHDAGEPGRSDTLEIQLDFTVPGETTPYHRVGALGGGNIQTR
jgi:hypothetical protein